MKIMDRFHRLIGYLLISSFTATASAQPLTTNQTQAKAIKTTAKPQPIMDSGERFLFVVDTSSRMRKLDDASGQTLFDLIFSGVSSHMTNGDTFGLWTFNEQAYAGQFPMQVWHSASNLPLASVAATFLKQQKYDGKARIGPLLTRLASVVTAVKDVNIFIISDGNTPLEGTALDTVLNGVYNQKRKEQKASKKPFITTLVMRGGQLVQGDVTLPGEAIQLPARVPKPVVAKTTTTPPRKPSAANTNSFKGKVLAQAPPDPRTNFVMRATPPPVSGTIVTQTSKTNIQAQGATVSTAIVASASVPTHPSHSSQTTNTPAAAPPPFSAFVAATPVAAREKTVDAIAPVAATLAPANPLLRPGGLIMSGALLLLAALTMLYWGLRRVRAASAQTSFISRSMDRH